MDVDPGEDAAARPAAEIGFTAGDALLFLADLGEELPLIKPVLKTLGAIHEKVETVKSNREGLAALHKRCTDITHNVIEKCRRSPTSEMDVTPLQECVEAVGKLVERCSRPRNKWLIALKASRDKNEIAGLNSRVDQLTGDLGLAGIAAVVSSLASAACLRFARKNDTHY